MQAQIKAANHPIIVQPRKIDINIIGTLLGCFLTQAIIIGIILNIKPPNINKNKVPKTLEMFRTLEPTLVTLVESSLWFGVILEYRFDVELV